MLTAGDSEDLSAALLSVDACACACVGAADEDETVSHREPKVAQDRDARYGTDAPRCYGDIPSDSLEFLRRNAFALRLKTRGLEFVPVRWGVPTSRTNVMLDAWATGGRLLRRRLRRMYCQGRQRDQNRTLGRRRDWPWGGAGSLVGRPPEPRSVHLGSSHSSGRGLVRCQRSLRSSPFQNGMLGGSRLVHRRLGGFREWLRGVLRGSSVDVLSHELVVNGNRIVNLVTADDFAWSPCALIWSAHMAAKTPSSLRSYLWFPCSTITIWLSLITRILSLLYQGTPTKLGRM
jgi:hypothetical protein